MNQIKLGEEEEKKWIRNKSSLKNFVLIQNLKIDH